jgi:hypothetical protein
MKKTFLFLLSVLNTLYSIAQFAPPVGQIGTTAMHKDSSAFIAWANGCQVIRGFQDISQTSLGTTTVGTPGSATGKADGVNVVSLGDGGFAILQFPSPITNGVGFDFAVFENAFNEAFLELAFVEVSSNGLDYVRFPATCNHSTTQQIGPFDNTCDATKLNNLAGKYISQYGTPFDLQDLQAIAGPEINLNAIRFVKIRDVVGSINPLYGTRDKNNNLINDPWPTAFASGGFDLDAVGVINQQIIGLKEYEKNVFQLYPSVLCKDDFLHIQANHENTYNAYLMDAKGLILFTETHLRSNVSLQLPASLSSGLYFLHLKTADKPMQIYKLIIQ